MLKTDYAKVSEVYDKNKGRLDFPKDRLESTCRRKCWTSPKAKIWKRSS